MVAEFVRFMQGSRDYLVRTSTDAAADIIATSGANTRYIRMSDEGLTFSLMLSQCRMIESAMRERGVEYEITGEHGPWKVVRRYKKRIGIPIGALIFLLLLFLSERFIWTFEVVGNDTVPDREILEQLDKLGCSVGTYIPSVDFDSLHNLFLLSERRISWISVNLNGTHAMVEVRETQPPATHIDANAPHNLVASEAGLIEYSEILRGAKIAREGDYVNEGDLLASGVVQMKHGLSLIHARGSVMARVKREIKIEVPLKESTKMLTGREFSEKTLNFFGISLKIFKNTSNLPENCDKIIRESPLSFFDAVTVPITLHETVYREYSDAVITRSEEEAKAEAYKRLRAECAAVAADSEIVSRNVSAGLVGGAYVIECELEVIRDIAREVPIYLENDTGEN